MSRRPWNISILQLLLLTALCAMCAGVVAVARQTAGVGYLQRLVFSPDGRWLAACYYDGLIQVWDLTRRTPAARRLTLAGESEGIEFSGARFFDADTLVVLRQVYSPQRTDELLLWDVRRNQPVRTIPVSPLAEIWAVSPAGNLAATSAQGMPYAYATVPPAGSTQVTIELWELDTGQAGPVLRPAAYFDDLIVSADGSTLVALGSTTDSRITVQVFDTSSGAVRTLELDARYSGPFAALSGDGKCLAFLSWDDSSSHDWSYTVDVYDLETGTELARFDTGEVWERNVWFSPDGRRLLVCSSERGIQLWDIDQGTSPDGFADSGLARLGAGDIATFSPDGRWIATGSDGMISLWDADTFAHVDDLYRDRRRWAGFVYSLGFVGWAATWGWLSRRRRAREAKGNDLVAAIERPLPRIVRAGLKPGQQWLKVLSVALGVGSFLAWAWAQSLQHFFGWSFVGTLALLVPCCTVGFLVLIVGIALVPPTIRRWRGLPNLHAMRRAERSAGVTGRRILVGPITGCFLGDSQLAATFVEDYEAVRQRFAQWFGTPIEPQRPLTALIFERTDWYEAHLDGHVPMAGVYWMTIDRQVLICEEMSLRWLTEPRRLWRILLARYFFEQVQGFRPTAGLAGILGCRVLFDLDQQLPQRVHRRLQAMLQRGELPWEKSPLAVTDQELAAAVFDPDPRKAFLRVTAFQTQCASLAEYLWGPAAENAEETFCQFLRQLRQEEPLLPQLLDHLDGDAGSFEQSWCAWALRHPTDPVGRPSAAIQQVFAAQVLPLIVDDTAPLVQRAEAIRYLGSSGYEIGIEALIGLLHDERAEPLRQDVVWSLESISGRVYGGEVAAWQRWWDERCAERARPAAMQDAIFVAELADSAAEPVLAELSEPQVAAADIADGDVPGASGSADAPQGAPCQAQAGEDSVPGPSVSAGVPAAFHLEASVAEEPPSRLKVARWLLLAGGLIAVVWSVYWTLYLGHEWMFASLLGILAGTHALTRFTGRETRGLAMSAMLLSLCVLFCNVPSALIGLIAARPLNHPQVRQYLRGRV